MTNLDTGVRPVPRRLTALGALLSLPYVVRPYSELFALLGLCCVVGLLMVSLFTLWLCHLGTCPVFVVRGAA